MATSLPPEAACEKTHDDVLQDVLLAQALEAPHSHSSAQKGKDDEAGDGREWKR